jgi:hypothetical protein
VKFKRTSAFLWCLRYAKRDGAREREKRKERERKRREKSEGKERRFFSLNLIIFTYSLPTHCITSSWQY